VLQLLCAGLREPIEAGSTFRKMTELRKVAARGVLIYIAKLTVCNAENFAEIRKVRSSTKA
jgi:hypothetical protein